MNKGLKKNIGNLIKKKRILVIDAKLFDGVPIIKK